MIIRFGVKDSLIEKIKQEIIAIKYPEPILSISRNSQEFEKHSKELLKLIKQALNSSKVIRLLRFITKNTPYYIDVKSAVENMVEDIYLGLLAIDDETPDEIKNVFYSVINKTTQPIDIDSKYFRKNFGTLLPFIDELLIKNTYDYFDYDYLVHCKDMIRHLRKRNRQYIDSETEQTLISMVETLARSNSYNKSLFEYLLSTYVSIPSLSDLSAKMVHHFYSRFPDSKLQHKQEHITQVLVKLLLSLGNLSDYYNEKIRTKTLREIAWVLDFIHSNPTDYPLPNFYNKRGKYKKHPKPTRKSKSKYLPTPRKRKILKKKIEQYQRKSINKTTKLGGN